MSRLMSCTYSYLLDSHNSGQAQLGLLGRDALREPYSQLNV